MAYIFLFAVLGFLLFGVFRAFLYFYLQVIPSSGIPFIGAVFGAIIGYAVMRKSAPGKVVESFSRIVALLFTLLGGAGVFYFGSLYLLGCRGKEIFDVYECGLAAIIAIPAFIIFLIGCVYLIVTRKKINDSNA